MILKLNVKKTLLCGIPFLSIMLLWQAYNWMVPIYLNDFFTETLKVGEMLIGIIMALDNLFAIFMIPLVANLSDKCQSKYGRRKPFIIFGIIFSALFFVAIPYVTALDNIWLLILNILCVLISMNVYRAPAVALMPDITPEHKRSKANSIINIMGAAGTALGYLLILLFEKNNEKLIFFVTAFIMIVCLVYTIIFLKEKKMVEEYKLEEKAYNEQNANQKLDETNTNKEEKVSVNTLDPKIKRRNIILILLTVFFFYMSINSVETFMSLFSKSVYGEVNLPLGLEPGALCMIPFGIGCFAFSYPAAALADKYGRKVIIFLGTIIGALAYLGIAIISSNVGFSYAILPLFLLGGFGFAFLVINILPMALENSTESTTGKYTGYYYTASMIAQSVTPALCGLFMSDLIFGNMLFLFPYAIIFMLLAGVCILLVKNKGNKENKKLND